MLEPNDRLQSRWRVERALREGGMGSVFLVRDEHIGAMRVVKLLRADAEHLLQAFRGEFALLAQLSHPNLVRVFDFASERVRGVLVHYYVAEYIDGQTLGELATRKPASAKAGLKAVVDALEGLAVLHDAGLRHGDFSPANVVVDAHGRGKLIDLGCAEPFGAPRMLAGSEGFMAPELFQAADAGAAADLFSVGRTLQRLFESSRERPSASVARLVQRLTREDPSERPTHVREVLEVLDRRPRARRYYPPARLIGRRQQLSEFREWLGSAPSGGPSVCAVVGPSGSGVSRLLGELVSQAQLELPVLRCEPGRLGALHELLGPTFARSSTSHALQSMLAVVPLLAERGEPLLLVVEDYERLPAPQRELVIALLRALPSGGRVHALIGGQTVPDGLAARELSCEALTLSELRQWASPFVAERKLAALHEASAGLPSRVQWLLERLSGGEAASFEKSSNEGQQLPRLPTSAREALALLAASGGEQISDSEPLDPAALDELLGLGVVQRSGARYRVAAPIARAIENGGLERELVAAHRGLAALLSADATPPSAARTARLAFHWAQAAERATAEELVLKHQAALRDSATLLWPDLVPLAHLTRKATVLLALSSVMLEGKQPRRALSLAIRAARLRPELYEAASLRVVDSLIRLGRPARAARLVSRAVATAGSRASSTLLDRLARAMLAGGDYDAARPVAERALARATTTEERARASEALGISLSYSNDLDAARGALADAIGAWGAEAAPRELYRAQSFSAIVAFRAGDLSSALSLGESALALAEEHDLGEVLPIALLNLGTAEQQCGLWGRALERYERGLTFARAIGRVDTELTLEFNLANLLVEIGAFERAEALLARLSERVRQQRLKHVQSSIFLLRAEMHLLQSEWDAAEAALDAAERELGSAGPAREQLELGLRRVELELGRGDTASASQRLRALADSRSPARDLEFALALQAARLAVAQQAPTALSQLEQLSARARAAGALAQEALACSELAVAAESLSTADDAAGRAERARRLWDRVGLDLPSTLGTAYWRHPRRARSVERSRAIAAPTSAPEALVLKRLLSLVRRLNSPHSLDSVLDFTTSAAVELTSAERGFLLLLDEDEKGGSLKIRRASEPTGAGEQGPSHSIAQRALLREEAVLTADAQADPRFVGQGSVHALQLKSVLCVPVLAPGGALGVVYVDSRVQRNRFTAADRDILAAFADHVAVAIGNARRVAALEQRTKELEQQRQSLQSSSEGHLREVERLKKVMLTQQQSIELRHDYSRLVGRGPAMRRLLGQLDKLTDSDVNVLILGESGTGKELVARSLHTNGPRREGPFLGVNCAALPETLLESELFGHVKGAFTGADRDKLGLLQAANGGTLFLDEVGELPLTTQAKLLRVLQEREVQPLGSISTVPLDIRLLAATHRDLSRAVAARSFREDLYYRVAVVSVEVPPLRERLEDLPALAGNVLERLAKEAGRKRPELAPSALRKLSAHPFRGNVRELENLLTRAFVLAAGPRIGAEDLDLGKSEPRASIDTRQDFEDQERATILEALRGHRWNVTSVASSLGMPRVTLHRKLKRYGITRSGAR